MTDINLTPRTTDVNYVNDDSGVEIMETALDIFGPVFNFDYFGNIPDNPPALGYEHEEAAGFHYLGALTDVERWGHPQMTEEKVPAFQGFWGSFPFDGRPDVSCGGLIETALWITPTPSTDTPPWPPNYDWRRVRITDPSEVKRGDVFVNSGDTILNWLAKRSIERGVPRCHEQERHIFCPVRHSLPLMSSASFLNYSSRRSSPVSTGKETKTRLPVVPVRVSISQ